MESNNKSNSDNFVSNEEEKLSETEKNIISNVNNYISLNENKDITINKIEEFKSLFKSKYK